MSLFRDSVFDQSGSALIGAEGFDILNHGAEGMLYVINPHFTGATVEILDVRSCNAIYLAKTT